MSMACSTECFIFLKSALSREGYLFINSLYSWGMLACAWVSPVDLMALIWKNSQLSDTDSWNDLGNDGLGTEDGLDTERTGFDTTDTLATLGKAGVFINSNNVFMLETVSCR